MTGPALSEVERVVSELASHSWQGRGVLQIRGPSTAGKSTALRAFGEKVGLAPILVSPPSGALDSGPAALIGAASALKTHGFLNGDIEPLTDPAVRWADKLSLLERWLTKHSKNVVVLCDAPLTWGAPGPESDHFAARARDVALVVLDSSALCVVAGGAPTAVRIEQSFLVPARSEAQAWLQDAREWGGLATAAEQLATSSVASLDRLSPLQLRLLVAHVALTSLETVESWLHEDRSRRGIGRRLAGVVAQRDDLRDLSTVWQRLALVRRPFTDQLLALAGVDRLEALERDVLDHGLLYRGGDGFLVLHHTLRRDAIDLRETEDAGTEDRRSTHAALSGFYRERFETEAESATALTHEIEAFHHAVYAGDEKILDDHRAFFVEQLDALGRYLSWRLHDNKAAVKVFDRSVSLDSENDYGTHYLAYNLDHLGEDQQRVGELYERAIELNDRHPWWRARYIAFLVTVGRTRDAREAWNEALDALIDPDAEPDVSLYESVHLQVVRMLLRRGQLDFAERVLRDVPARVLERVPELIDAGKRLVALREADAYGAVVPGPDLDVEWWAKPPRLLQPSLSGKKLMRWLVGRVVATDVDGIKLEVAQLDADGQQERPMPGTTEVGWKEMSGWDEAPPKADLEPGRFVEIGLYANSGLMKRTSTVMHVHEDAPWDDGVLTMGAARDPIRYLRAFEPKVA